ncbi:hypothetical protein [Chondromyces apiculatus]|uniref:Signal recognition particle-docking protein FtsY n=1 Tax=Chondromyces apiculatus DSM 436 TaxID=1192034 RepID=A0A017TB63_9BACT|nr:hypothetical protein [Chondromyces apiculatus]EYF05871.1 Signal recognition particle-docking protein FtsY [Chondromyces apiculatus DSM 436]
MPSHIRALSLSTLLLASVCSGTAGAAEIGAIDGKPVTLDLTNTAVVDYRFDNRNDDRRYPTRYVDDQFGEWIDRFNLQFFWWRLQLGVRVDTATYFITPSPGDAEFQRLFSSDEVVFGRPDLVRELNTRFLNTYYPAKLYVSYSQSGVEATVGDFYAQLGRGLVFSVRKLDELAIDTTVRGGKLTVNQAVGPLRLGGTFFGGQMNPLRIDEVSGRRLHGDGSPLFFGFPGRGSVTDLESVEAFADAQGNTVNVTQLGRPSYLEDTVVGGRVEAGTDLVQLAANGAMLLRKSYTREYLDCIERGDDELRSGNNLIQGRCANQYPEFTRNNASRRHDTIRNFGGSLNIPSIADHGDAYVEVVGQQLRDGHLDLTRTPAEDLSGYAVYASANARGGPLTLALEGKHYRRFFPLAANIDADPISGVGFGAPEFSLVNYSQPPTAEPIYIEPIGAPNVCITAGRARADYRFRPDSAVYAWLGRYVSWSELDPENETCDTSREKQTNAWDYGAGTDLEFEKGRSHARVWAGFRRTETEVPYSGFVGGEGELFYSETYVRYDIVKHLAGAFSLQFQGNHRRRFRPENFVRVWIEGENYTALQWAPNLVGIFGVEYTSQEGCEPGRTEGFCHYFNGGLQWKATNHDTLPEQIFDTVNLFVGQRRGGLRCVSGVCRFFPPLEGVRLELVSRF